MKRLAWFLFFVLYSSSFYAQQHKIDSLSQAAKTAKDDSNKVITLNLLTRSVYLAGQYKKADSLIKGTILLAQKIEYKRGLGNAYRNLGNLYWSQGNYTEALKNQGEALKLATELNDKKGMAASYGNIGNIFHAQGNYPEALNSQLSCLKLREEMKDKSGEGITYISIGNLYLEQANYPEALTYYNRSMALAKEVGNKYALCLAYTNIGNVYFSEAKYDEALENEKQSLKIALETADERDVGNAYRCIAVIYFQKHEYDSALVNEKKSLAISQHEGDKDALGIDHGDMGDIYTKKGKYMLARQYLDSSFAESFSVGDKNVIKDAYLYSVGLDSTIGDFKRTFSDYKMFIVYRDSLKNEENTKKMVSEQMTYDFDKKQATQKAEQDKKDALVAADKKRQQIVTASVGAGLLLVLMFSGLLFSRYRLTQKQKTVIEEQKTIVDEKNKEITDSITYAKRLQDAILPPQSEIKKHLPESLVLYKPKDIVAGDFYWMEKKGNTVFIAAADCTGHGVPGAMVSVVCSNALNRAVKEFGITEPGKILDKTRELVLETFEKSEGDIKDGMDISLCAIEGNKLQWAGAYNALLYVRNNELKELKPDKQPIGKQEGQRPFTTQELTLSKGDIVYLLTDGYADQFGGPKGKKFKHNQLCDSLLQVANKPMEEQKEVLNGIFENWKGNLEQTDDVCIIGIRL